MPTERERMLAGALYVASDPELVGMRARARQLMHRFNHAAPDDERRLDTLRELLGRAGDRVEIEPPFFCDYGVHIHLGENVFVNFNCVFLDCATITIGNNVQVAPGVQLLTAYHPVGARERIRGPELAAPISVGDNAWLGAGAIVLAGVTIGADTTIGAGSVVTRDVPAGVVAAGNPCRVIRTLGPKERVPSGG